MTARFTTRGGYPASKRYGARFSSLPVEGSHSAQVLA